MSLIGDWKSNPHGSIDGDLTDLIPTEALTPVNKQENSKKKKKKDENNTPDIIIAT